MEDSLALDVIFLFLGVAAILAGGFASSSLSTDDQPTSPSVGSTYDELKLATRTSEQRYNNN
jgi:hypothetical protein